MLYTLKKKDIAGGSFVTTPNYLSNGHWAVKINGTVVRRFVVQPREAVQPAPEVR